MSACDQSLDKNYQKWLNEAKFGLSNVQNSLNALPKGSYVLEVGSGSGILLRKLSELYPHLNFVGIEPFSNAFSDLKNYHEHTSHNNLSEYCSVYENFATDIEFDLIFCVNVFEHLINWKDFLEWSHNRLKKNGSLIALCPNYGFPYESHFGIPIIFNKSITFRAFRYFIKHFEKKHSLDGLWASLNFVTKREVQKFLSYQDSPTYELIDHLEIFEFMINRLSRDDDFSSRQGIIGKIAILFFKFKLLQLFKLMPNLIPYMKLEFIKK